MSRKPEPPRRLGRGLSALLGDAGDLSEPAPGQPRSPGDPQPSGIPIDLVAPNPDQPRRRFDEADLEDLAASIREHGVLQPVILRPDPADPARYQIVAGERRWRAASRAGLHEIPAIVRALDDRTVLEIAIIENIQRADLNPVEEARGYAQLVESFGHTQEDLARIVGKSRSHLANMMRLLALPDAVLGHLAEGRLSAGHARALVTAPDPVALAEAAIAEGLSVRQIEARAKAARGDGAAGAGSKPGTPGGTGSPKAGGEKDADTRILEGDLSAAIGMAVLISHDGPDGGEVRIRYRSLEDLDRLCQRLAG